MEQEKRGHGRPKIDTSITETGAPSRRQAVNAMYMFEGVNLISVAATEIPNGNILWSSDDATQTAKSKNGILEQLGRLWVQDRFDKDSCIYVANLAIAALKNGCTSREVEKAMRNIRIATKKSIAKPDDKMLSYQAGKTVEHLSEMGENK